MVNFTTIILINTSIIIQICLHSPVVPNSDVPIHIMNVKLCGVFQQTDTGDYYEDN